MLVWIGGLKNTDNFKEEMPSQPSAFASTAAVALSVSPAILLYTPSTIKSNNIES